ncbi:GNAT family N-acetyltransferase [Asticcacaulis solisilvae]|uniref:GNAT family N-acetyltransferase n=1 Tax=Asticcacaulis solisilvae TaxID=1217274 RepID=UPI003FD6FDFB
MIPRNDIDRRPAGAMPPEQISIETTRLSLTPLKPGDLDALMAVFSDKNSARMTHAIPHPLAREEAEKLLADMCAARLTYWAVRIDDEQMVGLVSLTRQSCGKGPGLHSFGPNLSVFIAPAFQGKGYALEAVEGLLRWVKKRKLHRVVHAAHFADNEASGALLNNADFLYTGRRTMETSLAREGEHLALHMIRIL